jgi:hypothetical protein
VRAVQDGGAGVGEGSGASGRAGGGGESEYAVARGNGAEVQYYFNSDAGIDAGRLGGGPNDGGAACGGYSGFCRGVVEVRRGCE